jgi:hypothetical protein
MTRPLAANSASWPSGVVGAEPDGCGDAAASAICEATVRCQISSYSRSSSPDSSRASSPGVRKTSPDGRIASCASWAFFTLPA